MTRKRFLTILLAVAALACVAAVTVTELGGGSKSFVTGSVAVTAELADVCTLPVLNRRCTLDAEIYNNGSIALTDVALQGRDQSGGEWYNILSGSQWADSTIQKLDLCTNNATNPLPNTLAAGKKAHVWVTVNAPCELRFAAQRAAGATDGSVVIRGIIAPQ